MAKIKFGEIALQAYIPEKEISLEEKAPEMQLPPSREIIIEKLIEIPIPKLEEVEKSLQRQKEKLNELEKAHDILFERMGNIRLDIVKLEEKKPEQVEKIIEPHVHQITHYKDHNKDIEKLYQEMDNMDSRILAKLKKEITKINRLNLALSVSLIIILLSHLL